MISITSDHAITVSYARATPGAHLQRHAELLKFSSLLIRSQKLWLAEVDVVARACRQQVDKKTVLENLDLLLLVMDEVVDGG